MGFAEKRRNNDPEEKELEDALAEINSKLQRHLAITRLSRNPINTSDLSPMPIRTPREKDEGETSRPETTSKPSPPTKKPTAPPRTRMRTKELARCFPPIQPQKRTNGGPVFSNRNRRLRGY